ncbi:MAG: DUF2092 domain-containing protein [Puia sp.]|nr:DUF2092 domain-containing protein [Puia sp.]
MNQRFFFSILICAISAQANAQTKTKATAESRPKVETRRIDTVAVSILDRMSAMIGDLASCGVTVKSSYDINSQYLGLVKHSNEYQVFLQGPDKLLIRSEGDKGSRSFLYNGKTLNYYSIDKNQYAEVQAPPTIMEMIDTVNKIYGIEFPIADFFYPTFVDDILSEAKNLMYLGTTKVDGKECFHIAGTASDKTFQFWVSNDAYTLPMKVVIIYTDKEKDPQYEAVLSDWQINPSLPPALFEFNPPPKARKIKLATLSVKK